MKKKSILIIGMILFTNVFCTAQVESFTRYYNLNPDWVGNYFEQKTHTPI